MDVYFVANDPPKPNSTSNKTINVLLINPDIYTIASFSEYSQYH